MAISKQDLHGARTAADVERKYNFGKTFKEVFNLTNEAKDAARKASEATKELDKGLTAEELFNRLTNNGEEQGIYRASDGKIYINASYIKAGKIVAGLIKTGIIKSVDGKTYFDLDNAKIVCGGDYGEAEIIEAMVRLNHEDGISGVQLGLNPFGSGGLFMWYGDESFGFNLNQGEMWASLRDFDDNAQPVVTKKIGFKTINGVCTVVAE